MIMTYIATVSLYKHITKTIASKIADNQEFMADVQYNTITSFMDGYILTIYSFLTYV
jgi:hypothetical protein